MSIYLKMMKMDVKDLKLDKFETNALKNVKKVINDLNWKQIKKDYFDGVKISLSETDDYGVMSDEQIVKDFYNYLSENCV